MRAIHDATGSTTAANATTMPRAALLRAYAQEARCEFLRVLREPSYAAPVLAFPALFYLLFGVLLDKGDGRAASYMLATYGVFGIIGAALFGFGVTIAIDRGHGYLRLKRALPMPPGALLLAKLAMAMLFATLISLLLAGLAVAFGGVSLRASQWALLLAVNVLGVLPFAALGLFIGTLVGGNAAPAVLNLLYLPMAFLSGLWMPLAMLPEFMQQVAPVFPAYHLGQLALKVVGMDAGKPAWQHLAALAVVTVACFALAQRRLARAE